MKRHELDLISLVSGLLFAGLGSVFALHALGAFSVDVGVVPAVVLIVLGLAGIAAALRASARAVDRSVEPVDDPAGVRVTVGSEARGPGEPAEAGVGEVAGPPLSSDL